ncbi:MAG: PEGA domain-containing protein [Methanomicrobiaceae archaeon]|nr:PEGA domain-containing protein [Methanomicrobiaceae archaeon]
MTGNRLGLILIAIASICALSAPAGAVGGDMGWYTIHCNINGASVYFDGSYMGQTAGGVLSVGVYSTGTPYSQVSVQKSGYYTATTNLPATPSAGETANVYVTLNPMPTTSPTGTDTGGLYITTSPTGARIHLNSVYQGVSPLSLSGLRTGTYTVEAEMDGYEASTTSVYVSGGYTQNVFLSMVSPGSVSVTSNPTDAYVAVNGKTVGKTPYVITGLSSGDHEITVSKNGYYNYKKTVNVVEGAQLSVYAVLDPITTSNEILVTSEPPGAKIFLDGVYVGETMDGASYPVQNVATGQHQIKLTLAGYPEYITYVTMTGAQISVFAEMGTTPSVTTGSIAVSSTPQGAMIYIDDVYTGVLTPYTKTDVSPGEHTIMLRLSGYQDTYSKITVYAGQTATLTMGLASTGSGESPTPVPTQSSPGFAILLCASAIFAAYILIKKE